MQNETLVKQGIYMFGGVDHNEKINGDLYLIQPHYFENKELICTSGSFTGYFKRKVYPHLKMTMEKVETHGVGPIARFAHAACYLQTDNAKMLIIHGGRNDHIFSTHKNTALNDLHILDL